jgi:hypothetical protein
MRLPIWIMSALSFLVVGCQSGQPIKQSAIDNTNFMSLWNTYSHCQNSTDFEQLKQDAVVLSGATKQSFSREPFVIPLPGKLERLVATPSARLAVDVKAMSAACSLRAGQAALDAGRVDLARDLFLMVLNNHPQPEYTFYRLQAKALLSEIETQVVQVSLKLP